MKMFKNSAARAQKGFTLLELFVVVLVLGIIAAFLIPAFTSGGSANARGKAVVTFTTQAQGIVRTAISQLQLPYLVDGTAAANNMVADGQTWLDVIAYGTESPGGTTLVKAEFESRYGLTGAGALREAMALDPDGADEFDLTVQGYPVTLTQAPAIGADDGDPRVWAFNFTNVPSDVVTAVVTQLVDSNLVTLTPADLDDANLTVRYTAEDAATGLRGMTILRSMR